MAEDVSLTVVIWFTCLPSYIIFSLAWQVTCICRMISQFTLHHLVPSLESLPRVVTLTI